jgi:hypothetical protein
MVMDHRSAKRFRRQKIERRPAELQNNDTKKTFALDVYGISVVYIIYCLHDLCFRISA